MTIILNFQAKVIYIQKHHSSAYSCLTSKQKHG